MSVESFLVFVIASPAYEKFDGDEVLFFLVKLLGFEDPGYFSSSAACRPFTPFFFVDWYLFCYSRLDRMGDSGGRGDGVGFAVLELCLEASAFLSLGDDPCLLLLA